MSVCVKCGTLFGCDLRERKKKDGGFRDSLQLKREFFTLDVSRFECGVK